MSKITKLEQDIDSEEKFDDTRKQRTNLKKYMITLLKALNFPASILGINTVKNLQNFSTAWKRKIHRVKLLKHS